MKRLPFFIGWYRQDHVAVMIRHYETAAWYTKVLVEPGRYPIFWYPGWSGYGAITINFHGTVQTDWFPSLYCGNMIGTYDRFQNAGNPFVYSQFLDVPVALHHHRELGDRSPYEFNSLVSISTKHWFVARIEKQYGWQLPSGPRTNRKMPMAWTGPHGQWHDVSRITHMHYLPLSRQEN